MPRVFITNDTGLDFSKAEKFGELVKLTARADHRMEGGAPGVNRLQPERLEQSLREALRSFQPGDFLLLTGDTLVSFLCALVLMEQATELGGVVRLLLFDPVKRDYFIRTIDLE